MPQVIHWGLVGMGESGRLKSWGTRKRRSVPGRAVFAFDMNVMDDYEQSKYV